jgi:hypothetical protein
MYQLLPQISDFPMISETTSEETIPPEFLTEAVFAGGAILLLSLLYIYINDVYINLSFWNRW